MVVAYCTFSTPPSLSRDDAGRKFDGLDQEYKKTVLMHSWLDGSPRFLKIGVTSTLAHFHCDGNTVVLSDKEVEITGAVSFCS